MSWPYSISSNRSLCRHLRNLRRRAKLSMKHSTRCKYTMRRCLRVWNRWGWKRWRIRQRGCLRKRMVGIWHTRHWSCTWKIRKSWKALAAKILSSLESEGKLAKNLFGNKVYCIRLSTARAMHKELNWLLALLCLMRNGNCSRRLSKGLTKDWLIYSETNSFKLKEITQGCQITSRIIKAISRIRNRRHGTVSRIGLL